jgi:hypothetical protein
MKKSKRVELVSNYNTFYVLPTIRFFYETYEGSLEYMYIDFTFLKWTLSFAIKRMEFKS